MARIFIDLTEDEQQWNGDIPIRFEQEDDLGGTAHALAIGDHQIVLTTTQAITLFEVLDGWLNGGPVREVGAIKQRLQRAFKALIEDRRGTLGKIFGPTFTEDLFVSELANYIGMQGLRFRVTDEEPMFDKAGQKK